MPKTRFIRESQQLDLSAATSIRFVNLHGFARKDCFVMTVAEQDEVEQMEAYQRQCVMNSAYLIAPGQERFLPKGVYSFIIPSGVVGFLICGGKVADVKPIIAESAKV